MLERCEHGGVPMYVWQHPIVPTDILEVISRASLTDGKADTNQQAEGPSIEHQYEGRFAVRMTKARRLQGAVDGVKR